MLSSPPLNLWKKAAATEFAALPFGTLPFQPSFYDPLDNLP